MSFEQTRPKSFLAISTMCDICSTAKTCPKLGHAIDLINGDRLFLGVFSLNFELKDIELLKRN